MKVKTWEQAYNVRIKRVKIDGKKLYNLFTAKGELWGRYTAEGLAYELKNCGNLIKRYA